MPLFLKVTGWVTARSSLNRRGQYWRGYQVRNTEAYPERFIMILIRRMRFTLLAAFVSIATFGVSAHAQKLQGSRQMQLPNPYRLVENWPTLPQNMNGGRWGELIRADIDPKCNMWF